MQDGGFSKSSHFSNIWCFFKRFFPHNNSSLLVQLFSACFWPFSFLTQTEYFSKAIGVAWAIYSLCKMADFQNRLISPIFGFFSSAFLHRTTLVCLSICFSHVFRHFNF